MPWVGMGDRTECADGSGVTKAEEERDRYEGSG